MKQNELTKLDQHVKRAVESFEAPYDPSSWDKLSKALDQQEAIQHKAKVKPKTSLIAAVSGMVVAVLVSSIWLLNDSETNTAVKANQEHVAQPSLNKQAKFKEEVAVKAKPETQEKTVEPLEDEFREKVIEEQPIQFETESLSENTQVLASHSTTDQNDLTPENLTEQLSSSVELDLQDNQEQKVVVSEEKASLTLDIAQEPICLGSKMMFANLENVEARWIFSDGVTLVGIRVERDFNHAGSYTVEAVDLGKTYRNSNEYTIQVIANATPEIKIEEEPNAFGGHKVLLKALSNEKQRFKFVLGNKEIRSDQASITYDKKGVYEVELEATNGEGCVSTAKEFVYVDHDYNLLAPNSFSPNGDGQNDTWFPIALMEYPHPYKVEVLDKSGRMVYETDNADFPWDGKINGSTTFGGEVFIWKATIQLKNNKWKTYSGSITIFGN